MRSGLAGRVLTLAAWACRLLGWALSAIVVAGALLPAGPRALLLGVIDLCSRLVPEPLLGLFVFRTPFGGAFRGDFAIVAIVLLVLDWALRRISASLR